MPIPTLKLDLAPAPSLWQRHHRSLGWGALALGVLALAGSLAISWMAYQEARTAGRNAVLSSGEAREVVRKQREIRERLQSIDVEKELPTWRVAEKVLEERSLPWSRLMAELERSMVQDVRMKSIQRIRGSEGSVELKISGEAKTRGAEEAFLEALRQNACFSQVVLEREQERQGGGVEFDAALPIAPDPPSYAPLPQYGPARPGSAPAKEGGPSTRPGTPKPPSAVPTREKRP